MRRAPFARVASEGRLARVRRRIWWTATLSIEWFRLKCQSQTLPLERADCPTNSRRRRLTHSSQLRYAMQVCCGAPGGILSRCGLSHRVGLDGRGLSRASGAVPRSATGLRSRPSRPWTSMIGAGVRSDRFIASLVKRLQASAAGAHDWLDVALDLDRLTEFSSPWWRLTADSVRPRAHLRSVGRGGRLSRRCASRGERDGEEPLPSHRPLPSRGRRRRFAGRIFRAPRADHETATPGARRLLDQGTQRRDEKRRGCLLDLFLPGGVRDPPSRRWSAVG